MMMHRLSRRMRRLAMAAGVTIVAMALVSRNARAPAALLIPFRKEER